MPHAAHFICGQDCRFHLATKIGAVIVSTVGEYLPDSSVREILAEAKGIKLTRIGDARRREWIKKHGYEEIGHQRKYETMVFAVRPREFAADDGDFHCCLWDADVIAGEQDFEGYMTATDAYRGHMALCEKWAQPLAVEDEKNNG